MRDDENPKRLIVVGDRVLISPEEGEERTNVGLYLPPTALESRQVQGGRIIATGPGTPIDRKSTRLNSSHLVISYAVFCLKKKKLFLFSFPRSTSRSA